MLNLETVKQDIEQWIVDFVEVPHPALGGWAPCPYARKARLDRDFDVRLGLAPIHDLIQLSRKGLGGKSVVILAYDTREVSHAELSQAIEVCNNKFLAPADLLALEDHPDDVESVNGVVMNQGTYALALVQNVTDLDAKAAAMARKGFYDTWPEDYLTELFKGRKDPRSA
jgi:hypothetical protein